MRHIHRRRSVSVDRVPSGTIRIAARCFLRSITAASQVDRPRGNRESLGVILAGCLVGVQTEHGPENRDTERPIGLHYVWVG